ncbi:hypothetical protein OAQ84_01430 [Bdellovibrionales bacterium]|nr:hypothetical protein [Bdellovibrionales bacterium]
MIIRKKDLGKSGTPSCGLTTAPPSNGSSLERIAAHAAIRKVLRQEDWYVDVANRCAIPINENYCYGDDPKKEVVYSGSCDSTKGNCPHFVSVCTRTSGS